MSKEAVKAIEPKAKYFYWKQDFRADIHEISIPQKRGGVYLGRGENEEEAWEVALEKLKRLERIKATVGDE